MQRGAFILRSSTCREYMYPEWLHVVHDYAESTGESPWPSVASTTTTLLPYSRSGLLEPTLYNTTVTNSNECAARCVTRAEVHHIASVTRCHFRSGFYTLQSFMFCMAILEPYQQRHFAFGGVFAAVLYPAQLHAAFYYQNLDSNI